MAVKMAVNKSSLYNFGLKIWRNGKHFFQYNPFGYIHFIRKNLLPSLSSYDRIEQKVFSSKKTIPEIRREMTKAICHWNDKNYLFRGTNGIV